MKDGAREEAEQTKAAVAALKDEQKAIAEQLAATEDEIRNILLSVPNVPCDMVPEGKTAADNVVEKTGGPMPDLPEDALPHWELARKYNIIDFDLGVKITGAGFRYILAKVHACSALSSNSSLTKPVRPVILKCSHPM